MNSTTEKNKTAGSWLLVLAKNPLTQIVLNALVVTAAELFLKIGASATASLEPGLSWTGLTALASLWTWLGMACLVLSLVSWLYILRNVPLSVAFPLSHVVHVFIPVASWLC